MPAGVSRRERGEARCAYKCEQERDGRGQVCLQLCVQGSAHPLCCYVVGGEGDNERVSARGESSPTALHLSPCALGASNPNFSSSLVSRAPNVGRSMSQSSQQAGVAT